MAVRNTLGDLHNMLMEQMERLTDADEETLPMELDRSRAMSQISAQIIGNSRTIVNVVDKTNTAGIKPPRMLTA